MRGGKIVLMRSLLSWLGDVVAVFGRTAVRIANVVEPQPNDVDGVSPKVQAHQCEEPSPLIFAVQEGHQDFRVVAGDLPGTFRLNTSSKPSGRGTLSLFSIWRNAPM